MTMRRRMSSPHTKIIAAEDGQRERPGRSHRIGWPPVKRAQLKLYGELTGDELFALLKRRVLVAETVLNLCL